MRSQESAGIPIFVNRETGGRSFCAPQAPIVVIVGLCGERHAAGIRSAAQPAKLRRALRRRPPYARQTKSRVVGQKKRYVAQRAHKCGATRRAQGFATILRHPFSGRDTLPYKEQQSALRSGDLHETAIVMRMFAKRLHSSGKYHRGLERRNSCSKIVQNQRGSLRSVLTKQVGYYPVRHQGAGWRPLQAYRVIVDLAPIAALSLFQSY
jgi:hypothetical protein